MIARYSREPMAGIWDERHKYLVWLRVEAAVCEELARQGVIGKKDWSELKPALTRLIQAGGVDPKRVVAHEKTTRHDVIAFTTAVAEKVGPTARFVHFGLTSSDALDTAFAMQIQEAGAMILSDMDQLLQTLKKMAVRYKKLATIGRSHGIYAEPTSFGLKFLGWYCEWERNRARWVAALERGRTGKLSGAVGVNAHWSPEFEAKVLKKLGLEREPVSTQVVPRDRHAEILSVLALCGASLERIAVELRHLQRSEVGEVIEGFQKGQKGSSAMPHKRNPISSENLTGCARLLRAYAGTGYENIALWHERDISHSSVERVSFPDAFMLADYALERMNRVLLGLHVDEKKVASHLAEAGPVVYSGHVLLMLVQEGAPREEAYYWVQECAHGHLEGRGDFLKLLEAHPEIQKRIKVDKLRKLCGVLHQLRNVDEIYRQVFLSGHQVKR